MISSRKSLLTEEHIRASAFSASHELAEQAIHCLELVCELCEEGLSFQFKGGNSLLLVLDRPQRFSIDVDIATDCTEARIEKTLTRIVDRFGVFHRWQVRPHRTKPWIRLASYYLYYKSNITGSSDAFVMLDAQLHESPYRCEKKKVVCGDLFRSDVSVDVPLPSSIIGDKLLTLGPRTLGIPVGKGKAAQRLKHAFDVSRLLELKPDLDAIRESFNKCLAFENGLQGMTFSAEDVIRDTIDCCRAVSCYDEPPQSPPAGSVLEEHCSGISPFAAHLFRGEYSWDDLRIDMARVACCMVAAGLPSVCGNKFAAALAEEYPERRDLVKSGFNVRTILQRCWDHIDEWMKETGFTPQGKGLGVERTTGF